MHPWNLSGPLALALSLLNKSLVPVIDPSNLKYQINHLTLSSLLALLFEVLTRQILFFFQYIVSEPSTAFCICKGNQEEKSSCKQFGKKVK
jgi:hypothetical protein